VPVWAVALVATLVVVTTTLPGVYLWWPTRSDPLRRSDLGLALMTGALIAFAVLLVQVLIDFRTRQEDQRRQDASEHQSLQLSVGPPNLSGIDLSKADLSRFYLGGKKLLDANLAGANLNHAILTGARLMRADLTGANLASADLSRARLNGARLDGANLRDAVLYGADLDGASLSGAHLEGAVLTDAHLGSDLAGAHLQSAILDNARLVEANLTGANLLGAWLADADFARAVLYGANLDGTAATLRFATLTGAKYDTETTTWPTRFRPPAGKCQLERCVVARYETSETELKAFRKKLATRLPRGWTVVPKDPQGITLVSRGKNAEFNGEWLPAPPGWLPRTCATAYERKHRSTYAEFWPYEWFNVTFRGAPAVARRYGYVPASGRAQVAVDVYYVRQARCYRFRATSSALLFGLFRRDFGQLLNVLGVKPDVFRLHTSRAST
jgi:uncharacterized protein YjbI with pentapeptide repeats